MTIYCVFFHLLWVERSKSASPRPVTFTCQDHLAAPVSPTC